MAFKKNYDQKPRGVGQQGIGRAQLQNQKAGPRIPPRPDTSSPIEIEPKNKPNILTEK